ncbi:hypothetical protein EVAR_98476_1 [Eumeta japonica]|uniref:Uncharacterized protein n=1 Tax=Eumeta variegata TaxID=151549 RepID=A0A4C1YJ04_EUMVA|nr:hypothetical protein EVAR_98476_1 [Eumeta japonica]
MALRIRKIMRDPAGLKIVLDPTGSWDPSLLNCNPYIHAVPTPVIKALPSNLLTNTCSWVRLTYESTADKAVVESVTDEEQTLSSDDHELDTAATRKAPGRSSSCLWGKNDDPALTAGIQIPYITSVR